MHPFSILTLAIFVAGYITARWDLVTRLYELAIFAADHGVVVSLVSQAYLNIYENIVNLIAIDSCCQRVCRSIHIFFLINLAH